MHFLKKVEPGKDGSQRVSKVRYRSGNNKRETKKAGDKIPEMDNSDDKVCRGWILHLGHLPTVRGSSTMQKREREREKKANVENSPRKSLNVMASIRIRTSTSNSNYCFDFDWTLNHPP